MFPSGRVSPMTTEFCSTHLLVEPLASPLINFGLDAHACLIGDQPHTSSTLGQRSIFRTRDRHAPPDGTRQLNPPNGAAEKKRAFRFDEGWSLPTENPNGGVWWLLPQQRRHEPGGAPDLHFHDVMRGFATGV